MDWYGFEFMIFYISGHQNHAFKSKHAFGHVFVFIHHIFIRRWQCAGAFRWDKTGCSGIWKRVPCSHVRDRQFWWLSWNYLNQYRRCYGQVSSILFAGLYTWWSRDQHTKKLRHHPYRAKGISVGYRFGGKWICQYRNWFQIKHFILGYASWWVYIKFFFQNRKKSTYIAIHILYHIKHP